MLVFFILEAFVMDRRLLDIRSASEVLGLSRHTLYSWVCQRRIPFVKAGRRTMFDTRDLEKWIDQMKVHTREKQ